MMNLITCFILTFNEEKNIEKCILSVKNICDKIVIVDSFSTDNTISIAKKYGCEVFVHPFENHSKQIEFALNNCVKNTKWVLKMDADEELTDESSKEILEECKKHENDNINGIILRFKFWFISKYLRHGGAYPVRKLSVFKYGYAHVEMKNMDEHIVLNEGKSIVSKKDSLHNDRKSLNDWVIKHVNYAARETSDFFGNNGSLDISKLDKYSKRKNTIKKKYYLLPSFIRAKLYFLYRYVIKLGFLDGKPGKIYAFLQAYWYRFLIDSLIFEYEQNNK